MYVLCIIGPDTVTLSLKKSHTSAAADRRLEWPFFCFPLQKLQSENLALIHTPKRQPTLEW